MPRFVHLEEERQQRLRLVERVMQWVALATLVVIFVAGFAR